MNKKTVILVIDDDKNICNLIELYLIKTGYEVIVANDGIKGIELFKNNQIDLVLLDILLPQIGGWDILKEIRMLSTVPVIMVTSKGESFDKVKGLELGADDYIVKPFDSLEMVARIKAVLRRYQKDNTNELELKLGNTIVDKSKYIVKIDEHELEMPSKEFELLNFFVINPKNVFTREQLIENVWGFDFSGDDRTVDVHIKRIRQKLKNYRSNIEIKTVWGVGYKLEVI